MEGRVGAWCRRRHGRRELGCEDVLEVALRGDEVDVDRPVDVVHADPGDPALLSPRETRNAGDVVEEPGARGVEDDVALDRPLEVARAHQLTVRIAEPGPKLERVDTAVRRNVRQRGGEVRDERRALRPTDVLVANEGEIDVPHHPPAFGRVGETRVEIVRRLVHRDLEVRELVWPAGRGRHRRHDCCRRRSGRLSR